MYVGREPRFALNSPAERVERMGGGFAARVLVTTASLAGGAVLYSGVADSASDPGADRT